MSYDGTIILSGYSGVANSDIAAFLGRTLSTAELTLATSLIKSAEAFIARECKRQFHYVEGAVDVIYTETLDAGIDKFTPRNLPIKEVTKITLDGVVKYEKGGVSNTYVLGTDFFVYPDEVVFDTIPSSSKDDKLALTIEYSIKKFWDEDLVLAVKRWVSEMMTQREYGGKTVSRVSTGGGLSLDFNSADVPPYVKAVIQRYKKYLV